MSRGQMHLGAFMRPVSLHTGAWRWPGAVADANFNRDELVRYARTLEAARFDMFFMADHLAVLNMPAEALARSHTTTSFEPFTLLSYLAAVTERIGLVATASTTYDAPYHIARRFASLDHLSAGRAGWNVVTTANPDAARNFGHPDEPDHGERYARAREFVDVVNGLWDSFDDDAFPRDVAAGRYLDPAKMHVLDHHGPSLDVRGPLNIARPPQGRPVIVQAGASEPGRNLAAETADVIFSVDNSMAAAQAFRRDIHRRAAAAGRTVAPKILPGAFVLVADTVEEAQERRRRLDSLVHAESAIASLSVMLGHDATTLDPDALLPKDLPPSNASRSGRERLLQASHDENLTVRELAQRVGGFGGRGFVGTARTIADQMQEWFETEACDGFNVMFPYLPAGLDDFCREVVPELQRRGVFRTEYAGPHLRDHLGLARPARGAA